MASSSGASVIQKKDRFYDKYFGSYQILTPIQLKKLSEHKYSASGTSIIEPPLQIFWRWLVEQIPLWWAPNALTSIGLLINFITTLILVYYSPDCIQAAPRWAYFLSGLGLFVYQTLDAIDGKQARRTKSSSPLGELFDHGCDSLSMGFVILSASICMQLGDKPNWLIFENFSAYVLYYLGHWRTYVRGTLNFGIIDVTEGQLAVIGISLISCFFGPQFWAYQLPLLHVPLKMLPIAFSLFGAILQVKAALVSIFVDGGVGKNGSTVAGTSTVFPVLPIAALVTIGVVIRQKSPTMLFEAHPCLYLLAFSLLAAKITNRLVVAHMTKSEMDFWDTGFLGPGALFLNQYFNSAIDEYLVLWICFMWVLLDVLRYSTIVCQEICEYLGIFCFTITTKPPHAKDVTS